MSFRLAYETYLTFDRERREHRVFQMLMQMIPGIDERLKGGSTEDLIHVGELVYGLSYF